MRPIILLLSVALLVAVTGNAAVPGLVQSWSGYTLQDGSTDAATDYPFYMPNGTLAGNALVVGCTYGSGSTLTSSVADDKSNTWTLGKVVNDSGNGQTLMIYYALNVAAGTRKITVTIGSAQTWYGCHASEFYNVATASAIDGSNGNTGSATSVTAGSITPTTSGDLIYMFTMQDGNGNNTTWTQGSQSNITWALSGANETSFIAAQWGVYNSTAALNPTMTQSINTSFVAVAIALKSASAGSAPSAGMRITNVEHVWQDSTKSEIYSSNQMQFPCGGGNLVVAAFVGPNSAASPNPGTAHITAVSDSGSNTWTGETTTQTTTPTQDASYAQIWWAANATTSNTMTITETFSSSLVQSTTVLYCITGAATSPFDTYGAANGNETTAPPGNISGASLTPAGANELVIGIVGVNNNTVSGVSGTGYLIDSSVWGGAPLSGPASGDENNGWAHYYTTGTSTVQFVFTPQDTVSTSWDYWDSIAVAFKSPAVAATVRSIPILQ